MGLSFASASSQYLEAALARSAPQPFTLAAFVRNAIPNYAYGYVACVGDASEELSFCGFGIVPTYEGDHALQSRAISFASYAEVAGGDVPATGVTFVAAVFDGSQMLVDVGGVRDTVAWTPSETVAFDVARIGQVAGSGTELFNGIIEHAMIFDEALTTSQLDALRAASVLPSSIASCVAWLPLKSNLTDSIGTLSWTPYNLGSPSYTDLGIEFVVGYAVTYAANGATSGTVPVDGSSPYDESDTVTVLGNSGSLARPGYAFSGWNTAADGSGTSYAPSATFSMPAASVTLYAQWTKGSRIINHDNVDASVLSSGEVSAVAAAKVYFEHASTGVDVVGDSTTDTSAGLNNDDTQDCGLKLLHTANSRYLFNRDYDESAYDATWFATHSGLQNNMRGNPTPATKVSGFVSNLATMAAVVDIAFFKYCWIDVWTETEGYISDGAAAAASDIATVVGLESTYGIDIPLVTMPLQSNASYAARQAYNDALRVYCAANNHWLWDFADIEAWDTTRHVDGNDREVAVSSYVTVDGGHLSEAGELRLAQSYWLLISSIVGYTPTYTVTYDGNEATGGTVPTDASSPYEEDATVTVLGNTGSLVRSGYVFAGWNTAADGSGIARSPGSTFAMPSAAVTLYARWLEAPSAVSASKGGSVYSAMNLGL